MSGTKSRRNRRIREMAADGETEAGIATACGGSGTEVARVLAHHAAPALTGAERMARGAEIARRVEAGETIAAVAAALGISTYTAQVQMREVVRARGLAAPVVASVPPVCGPARLVAVRPIGGGGAFGPDVEAADAAIAAADRQPYRRGVYPRAPGVEMSVFGSPAGLLADLGGA